MLAINQIEDYQVYRKAVGIHIISLLLLFRIPLGKSSAYKHQVGSFVLM